MEIIRMDIAIGFDRAYIRPLYVLITSIFANNKMKYIVIHALCPEITQRDRIDLTTYVYERGGNILFYPVNHALLKRFSVPKHSAFSLAIFYRLFFPEMIHSEVKKVLYLDSDIVVNADISPIFSTPMNGYPVGAIRDPFMQLRPDLGMSAGDEYFNSGVLLIDVEQWRAQRVTEKTIAYILANNDKMFCVDQDALNQVLNKNWLKLAARYNFIPLRKGPLSAEMEREALEHIDIVHFAGQPKPWGLRWVPFRKLYHTYYDNFSASYIGQKVCKRAVEQVLINLVGIEPSTDEWTSEKIIELAFSLHFIWLIESRRLHGTQKFSALLTNYYSKYDKGDDTLAIAREAFENNLTQIELLYCSLVSEDADTKLSWIKQWRAFCSQEHKLFDSSGIGPDFTVADMTNLPEMLNEQLMLVEPSRSVVYYIIENAVRRFDIKAVSITGEISTRD